MGNLCSAQTPESANSKAIDEALKKDWAVISHEIRLLLLGTGESGKSTIFKQMKLLQINGGFSPEELAAFAHIIRANVIVQMKVIINASISEQLPLSSPEANTAAEQVLMLNASDWSAETAEKLKLLWADPVIKEVYSMRDSIYQLNDSMAHFFDKIDALISPTYRPSDEDVLRARLRTTGIEEANFVFDDFAFCMIDVGGQRTERKKWITCFQDVTAVLFVAALSSYDQVLREDETTNRMHENLDLFDEITNCHWFQKKDIILFLNKSDLFQEKLLRKDMRLCFPDYTGGADFEKGTAFVLQKFKNLNRSPHRVYPHVTCALSRDNMTFVLKSVRNTLLGDALQDLGMAT